MRPQAGASAHTAAAVATAHEPRANTLAPARLLIHAAEGVLPGDAGFRRALGRWCAWVQQLARRHPPPPVRLEIADLQGNAVFTHDGLPSLTDLPLPAGTYHVTVRQGGHLRRYTVALERGVAFDLHLRGPG